MSDDPAHPGPRRSPGAWVKLFLVYGIGLISWTIYLIALIYLVYKFLG